jgi:hypothetical protein
MSIHKLIGSHFFRFRQFAVYRRERKYTTCKQPLCNTAESLMDGKP